MKNLQQMQQIMKQVQQIQEQLRAHKPGDHLSVAFTRRSGPSTATVTVAADPTLRFSLDPKATPEQVAFYVDMMRKVQGTPEWKEYVERTSQTSTFLTGDEFNKFMHEDIERIHKIAAEEGWLVSN